MFLYFLRLLKSLDKDKTVIYCKNVSNFCIKLYIIILHVLLSTQSQTLTCYILFISLWWWWFYCTCIL